MKKFLNIIFVIFINLIILSALILVLDYSTYNHYKDIFYNTHPKNHNINKFGYDFSMPCYINDLSGFYNGINDNFMGRKPDGLQYCSEKNNGNCKPIVVFGGSFAYGQYLKYNQTFSYKLSQKLKRPVYNRGIVGGSWHLMYFQTNDTLGKSFYTDVPPSDTVIYIMINDHFRRTLLYYFDILDPIAYPHYKYSNGKFVMDNYKNFPVAFINSLYFVKALNHIYADSYIFKQKNYEKLSEEALKYFILSKNELEKHAGKKVNFIVILYDTWQLDISDILKEKLEKNGFTVIQVSKLMNIDLNAPKYMMQDNLHPTEAAWDLFIPEFLKKVNLN